MNDARAYSFSTALGAAVLLVACSPIDERRLQLAQAPDASSLLPAPESSRQGCAGVVCDAAAPAEPDVSSGGELGAGIVVSGDAGPTLPIDAGESACSGCVIEGRCFALGTLNDQNPCEVCDPSRATSLWSPNDGSACDDGLFCTVEDSCQVGVCSGTPRVCDDDVQCNGVATCQEDARACSLATNLCGAGAFCDVTTGSCVSTCLGCLVDGVCVQNGAEQPGAPCRTCQPSLSTSNYTPAAGKPCGSGPSACSLQDTCDAGGICQPNDLPPATACGSSTANACDGPDVCDGNGTCDSRVSADGTPCDDGLFCSVGDRCFAGQCLPSGTRACGANQVCSEAADACGCEGCQVGATCFADGSIDPNNPCQACDTSRSRTAFSPNVGQACGSGPTDCSGQDTCDLRGQCNANDLVDGSSCGGLAGVCRSGQCVSRQQLGTDCTLAGQCLTGFCRGWFLDVDGDGHGSPPLRMVCSPDPAQDDIRSDGAGLLIPQLVLGDGSLVALGDDCCDSVGLGGNIVFPGKVSPVPGEQTACPERPARDFDCDGIETCFDASPEVCL
jgi:hypothetical protein